jgi:glucokinase
LESRYIFGVDIGGTWIRVAICTDDLDARNLKIKAMKTPKENEFAISNAVILLITQFLVEFNLQEHQVRGIGLASAGPLDINKGEVFNNANLGFKVIPLKEPIQARFPSIPTYLMNDCNASVLGIHFFEAEEDEKDNLVYITISTGIGGGVICNGHLLLGKEGNAAEIGHGKVEPKSPHLCNCGAHGCWEVYSAGNGMKQRAIELISQTELNSKILLFMVENDLSKINAKNLFQAAKGGDKFSKSIIEQAIFYMKVGIGLVNNFYDCACIYFGGAIMNDKDQILPALIEQFDTDPIAFTINHPPKLKVTKYINDIGVRGALTLVKYKQENNPVLS